MGSIEYRGYNQPAFRTDYTRPLNITGTSNTFAGMWNIVSGVLLGSGPNALGTNDITIGANAALETSYPINNPNGALILNGRMFLHQNDSFRAVTVAGTDLLPGTYTFDQLNSLYPAYFPATWTAQVGSGVGTGSGSITVAEVITATISIDFGDAIITFNTVPGWSYKVEYTDVLPATAQSWFEVFPGVQSAPSTTLAVQDYGATGASMQRFYRVVLVP